MALNDDGQSGEKRSGNKNLIAAIAAAVCSSVFLLLMGRWFGNWGFLAAFFIAVIAIESVRRTSNLNSLIRFGAAVGLLLGWLLHLYY